MSYYCKQQQGYIFRHNVETVSEGKQREMYCIDIITVLMSGKEAG